LYIGGAEHAVLHLLYARFWHKVLFDIGVVSTSEPFYKLVNQGLILGDDSQKMSKSRGNVVNPDQVIEEFGADALRLFEMFMGPLESAKPWSTAGIEGMNRFLKRIWRLVVDEETGSLKSNVTDEAPDARVNKLLHFTIKKITNDINDMDMKFNTCVSEMMIYINELSKLEVIPLVMIDTLIRLLSPFAPHMAEELWQKLGNTGSVAYINWPEYNPAKVQRSVVTVVGQVNGKVRAKLEVDIDTDEETLKQLMKQDEKVKSYLDGKEIVKEIVVKNKLVNIVVK
jgi:leucyl-tRNA synthetase